MAAKTENTMFWIRSETKVIGKNEKTTPRSIDKRANGDQAFIIMLNI